MQLKQLQWVTLLRTRSWVGRMPRSRVMICVTGELYIRVGKAGVTYW